jgi:peptide-methionine (S)-S-oxide reductase
VFWRAEDYHQKYALRGSAIGREAEAWYPDDEAGFEDSTASARLNAYVAGWGTAEQLERELPGLGLSPAAGGALLERVRARGGRTPRGCPR